MMYPPLLIPFFSSSGRAVPIKQTVMHLSVYIAGEAIKLALDKCVLSLAINSLHLTVLEWVWWRDHTSSGM